MPADGGAEVGAASTSQRFTIEAAGDPAPLRCAAGASGSLQHRQAGRFFGVGARRTISTSGLVFAALGLFWIPNLLTIGASLPSTGDCEWTRA